MNESMNEFNQSINEMNEWMNKLINQMEEWMQDNNKCIGIIKK
jgi:hypothetical protein